MASSILYCGISTENGARTLDVFESSNLSRSCLITVNESGAIPLPVPECTLYLRHSTSNSNKKTPLKDVVSHNAL